MCGHARATTRFNLRPGVGFIRRVACRCCFAPSRKSGTRSRLDVLQSNYHTYPPSCVRCAAHNDGLAKCKLPGARSTCARCELMGPLGQCRIWSHLSRNPSASQRANVESMLNMSAAGARAEVPHPAIQGGGKTTKPVSTNRHPARLLGPSLATPGTNNTCETRSQSSLEYGRTSFPPAWRDDAEIALLLLAPPLGPGLS